jgi:hypothetical protein
MPCIAPIVAQLEQQFGGAALLKVPGFVEEGHRLRLRGAGRGSGLLQAAQVQAGALPLLQFTLDQLYERREERCLTVAAYQALGGVQGALPSPPRFGKESIGGCSASRSRGDRAPTPRPTVSLETAETPIDRHQRLLLASG